jgi:hypothetical protein
MAGQEVILRAMGILVVAAVVMLRLPVRGVLGAEVAVGAGRQRTQKRPEEIVIGAAEAVEAVLILAQVRLVAHRF